MSTVGTWGLVRLVLRRDRVRLSIWVLALVLVTGLSARAVVETYDTAARIASYMATIGNSAASIAMSGPPVALDTIEGIVVFETALTALLGTGLMAAFTVVRHTRAEEETGRAELVASTVTGRHAGATAALLVATGASALVGAGVAVGTFAAGLAGSSAAVYGAAVTAFGVVAAALTALVAQLLTHARTVTGTVLALLGVMFAVRAVGDVRGNGWSWASPMGWSQQVRVGAGDRWWPLGLSAGLALVALAAAVALAARRDHGAGVVPARPGPAVAPRHLSGPLGLAWRLQRGSVLAWSLGVLALGLLFGSLSREVEAMVRDNPDLAAYFEVFGGSVTDAFFATAFLFVGLVAAGFAVSSALRTAAEEAAGRLESLLGAPVSRARVLLSPLLVTLLGSVVVVAAGGVGTGVAHAQVTGHTGEGVRLAALALVEVPAVLVLAGAAVLCVGWLPRLVTVAWLGPALAFLVGWLGTLLGLPDWVFRLSPFEHLPAVPAESFAAAPVATLLLLSLLLTAVGLAGFRRRDLA